MPDFKKRMIDLVKISGGEVSDGRFVERPGIEVVSVAGHLRGEAERILKACNISPYQSESDRLAEFLARITYLSFPKAVQDAEKISVFHRGLKEVGHTSPYEIAENANGVNVLFAGISLAVANEIIGHRGEIARTSTSRTAAMNDPLFLVGGSDSDRVTQKRRIDANLESKRQILREMAFAKGLNIPDETDLLTLQTDILRAHFGLQGELGPYEKEMLYDAIERMNDQDPASKSLAVVCSMSAARWEKVVKKRLRERGNVEVTLVETLELLRPKLFSVLGVE